MTYLTLAECGMGRRDQAVLWLARRVLRLASTRVAYGLMVAPVPPAVPGLPDRSAEWAALGGLIERTTQP